MVRRSHLQLLALPGGPPGSAGFRLTGVAREGAGLCRVWLRRCEPWERYLDPRFRSDTWDVRCFTLLDSAFALVEDFTTASLDDLAERFEFPVSASELAAARPNGDPVHDYVLAWAKSVTGAPRDATGTMPVVVEPVERTPDRAGVPLRAEALTPPPEVPSPVVSAETEPPTDAASTPPEPLPPVPPAPEPPAPVPPAGEDERASTGTMALTPIEKADEFARVSDAWDEIAEVAQRASGDHAALKD